MHFSALFEQDDVKQLLDKFRSIWRTHNHLNMEYVLKSVYAMKLRVKQTLEILLQAQTANQKCGEILEKLQRKQIELNCSLIGRNFQYNPPINLNGLINDALNVFETCYGIPLHCTLPIRNRLRRQVAPDLIEEWVNGEITRTDALSLDQKQVLVSAISETLALGKICQDLFSWQAVSDLTIYSVAGIVIGEEVPVTLPTLILMTNAIDNLKKKIRKEETESALLSLPTAEAGRQLFHYAFIATESHFNQLFDEFSHIYTQHFGPLSHQPIPPAPMQIENTPPPPTFAEMVKKPISVSDSNKDLLSLYAKSFQKKWIGNNRRVGNVSDRRKKTPPENKNATTVLIDGVQKILLRRDPPSKPRHIPSTQNVLPHSNRFTYLSSIEEAEETPEVNENESAAPLSPPTKSTKKKKAARTPVKKSTQSQKKNDEEFLLEKAIRENQRKESLTKIEDTAQPTHQEVDITKLLREGNNFLSGHDRGARGKEIRIEFVIKDLQQTEAFLDEIEISHKAQKNKKLDLLRLKKEITEFHKGILEGAIPQFLQDYREKTEVEVSLPALSKNWKTLLNFIEALDDIKKLGDYISNVECYFEPLLYSLSELETHYYVTHRVTLGNNPTNEVLFRHLRARSALFTSLYSIQLICSNQSQLDEIGCSTIVEALDSIQKNEGRIAPENLMLFFKQLIPEKQHKEIPRYITAWIAYAEEESYSGAIQLLSEKTNGDPLLFSYQTASSRLTLPLTMTDQEEGEENHIAQQRRRFKLR